MRAHIRILGGSFSERRPPLPTSRTARSGEPKLPGAITVALIQALPQARNSRVAPTAGNQLLYHLDIEGLYTTVWIVPQEARVSLFPIGHFRHHREAGVAAEHLHCFEVINKTVAIATHNSVQVH